MEARRKVTPNAWVNCLENMRQVTAWNDNREEGVERGRIVVVGRWMCSPLSQWLFGLNSAAAE